MGFSEAALDCSNGNGVSPPVDALSDADPDHQVGEDQVSESSQQEAVIPKQVIDVASPTAQEIKDHELTHLPFRNWCEHCVKGKSVERACKTTEHSPGALPTFHADYIFMGERESEGTTPILVVKDDIQKSVFANVVPSKGAN